jgi:catechol 2,3-dioxygenase-like lactoylglutathione lyase family enzyme
MNIRYAYGWIDGDSPNGIPVEVVVGVSQDPLMAVSLRVRDMDATKRFFIDELGMKVNPFPLARQANSNFEPQEPEKSVFVRFGDSGLGLILLPSPKNAPELVVGGVLDKMTIVYDDQKISQLPAALAATLETTPSASVVSPDGYTFTFMPVSAFNKIATSSVPPP